VSIDLVEGLRTGFTVLGGGGLIGILLVLLKQAHKNGGTEAIVSRIERALEAQRIEWRADLRDLRDVVQSEIRELRDELAAQGKLLSETAAHVDALRRP